MTLTQVAIWTRRGILSSFILMFLSIAGVIGYNVWRQYYLANLPPVEEKPEMRFGILPVPIFPPSTVSSANFSYSLDTVTGGLPEMPRIVKVYFIPKTPVSLMTTDRTKQLAQNLNFPNGPEILPSGEYSFTDDKEGNLRIDITTGNFHFRRQLAEKPSKDSEATESAKSNEEVLPEKNLMIQSLKKYLTSKNVLVDEIKDGRTNVVFNGTSPTTSSTADVSIWPIDLDGLPIITADLKYGLVRAQMNKQSAGQFTKMDYTVWPIDKTTFSTYPLKTPDQVLADLKADRGFVTIEPPSPQVSITSLYLAYYETEQYSPYLQPIFVFEGPNFAALVPAVAE